MREKAFIGIFIVGLFLGGMGTARASATGFIVHVHLASQGENVNAFGGHFVYPEEWDLESITLPNHSLLYWIQAPEVQNPGTVEFSGIFPGGMQSVSSENKNLALFSVEFTGQEENLTALTFEAEEFFLNHPTALPGTQASFIYTVDNSSFIKELDRSELFSDFNYSFEKDPITQEDVLIFESYRGALASYDFFTKEGNLGGGTWESTNGVQSVDSNSTTILLNARSHEGNEYKMTLRQSLIDHVASFLAWGVGVITLLYLFRVLFKTFKLRS